MQPLLGIENDNYHSASIAIEQYDPSPLTPCSKLVYEQWTMDHNDILLITGFFRESNVQLQQLSPDVMRIISSYYTKRHSKTKLKHKILQTKQYLEWRKLQQIQINELPWMWIILCIVLLLIFIFAPDVAGLVITSQNNCDLAIPYGTQPLNLSVTEHLRIGCISHMICMITLLFVAPCLWFASQRGQAFANRHQKRLKSMVCAAIFVCTVFFIMWGILGGTLNTSNKQCADMMFVWITVKFILYGLIVLAGLNAIQGDVINIFVVVFTFGLDIWGLVVVSKNDCDDTSKWIAIGMNEYILIGCGTHLSFYTLLFLCLLCMRYRCVAVDIGEMILNNMIYLVLLMNFFFISWVIVGGIFYLGLDRIDTTSNDVCAVVIMTFMVMKCIECIAIVVLFVVSKIKEIVIDQEPLQNNRSEITGATLYF
eukprot:229898_1